MDTIRALFTKPKSPGMCEVPRYDIPFVKANRYIAIPPKPSHMCGRSLAPKCPVIPNSAPPQSNQENLVDESNEVSRILFGEPVDEDMVEKTTQNRSQANRYPTMALFGSPN